MVAFCMKRSCTQVPTYFIYVDFCGYSMILIKMILQRVNYIRIISPWIQSNRNMSKIGITRRKYIFFSSDTDRLFRGNTININSLLILSCHFTNISLLLSKGWSEYIRLFFFIYLRAWDYKGVLKHVNVPLNALVGCEVFQILFVIVFRRTVRFYFFLVYSEV